MTDSSYVPGVGMGAQATAGYSNGTSGGSGLVVITYIAAGATSTVGSCACTGATPSNSNICTGDDVELATSTPRTLVSSCSPSTKCEYTCSSGYVLQDGACVAITYSCTGSAPSNANLCGGDADGLASDTPRKLVYDCSVPSEASKCEYTCSSGFTKDGEGCVSIYPDLVAFNTSPTSATVGVSVTLSATITNQGGALAGNSFKNLFQVALGANGGGDIAITNLASATSLPLAPGTSRDIYLPHTFTSAGIYSTRVCADKSYANDPGSNNEGPYEGNNCSAWVNVEVATIDDLYPDLTALNTSPATTTRNASTTLSAVITNRGAHSTGSGFQNFFQVATAADGGGSITGLSPVFISALASGASGSISSSYIFTSTGTSSVRACADKSSATDTGSVREGLTATSTNENNNCSDWVNVVVRDTQSCTKQPYCDANADGVNGVQNDVDPVACAYVYGGQCNPIPECLLKRGYCEVSTNTYFAVDSDTPDCKYVKAGYCTPPECRGYIPEHAASCPGDENVTSDSGRVLVSSCTPSKKCEYYCSPGYVKQGGECVSQYSCTGATPSNTNICTGDAAGLTANTPRTVALSCGTPKCQYTCSAGYELYADGVCRFGQCPVGYRQEGTGGSLSCRFDRCPEGWTESFDQILNQTRCTPPQGCFNRCGDVNQGEDHDDIINQCQSGSRRVYQCTNGCTLGGCNGTPPPSITEWLVTPLLIRAGNQVQVRWQTANTQLCTVVSANGDSWSGTEGSGGTVLSSQTVFTITCEGLPGSSPSSVSRSSTVNILPAFQER